MNAGEGMAVFTKTMSIQEAIQAEPRARTVFEAHGMGCGACLGAQLETIQEGARMHDIDPETILEELNGLGASGESGEDS